MHFIWIETNTKIVVDWNKNIGFFNVLDMILKCVYILCIHLFYSDIPKYNLMLNCLHNQLKSACVLFNPLLVLSCKNKIL